MMCILYKKIFHNRSTNSAAFCALWCILYHPTSLLCNLIINPFLTLRVSVYQDKELGFQPILKSFYSLMFLYCRISFTLQFTLQLDHFLNMQQPICSNFRKVYVYKNTKNLYCKVRMSGSLFINQAFKQNILKINKYAYCRDNVCSIA